MRYYGYLALAIFAAILWVGNAYPQGVHGSTSGNERGLGKPLIHSSAGEVNHQHVPSCFGGGHQGGPGQGPPGQGPPPPPTTTASSK